jgi:hypothetical protein
MNTLRSVRVTFTRSNGRRYIVTVERENGPRVEPRFGPGYDDRMPHDLAHYLIEEQFGIKLGIFGQLAAGGGGIFTPAPADRSGRSRRTAARLGRAGRPDMQRSEKLVYHCVSEWELRTGCRRSLPPLADVGNATQAELDRAVSRLEDIAQRWYALAPGESLTFTWPKSCTVNPAGSHQGRKTNRAAGQTYQRHLRKRHR